MKPWINRRLVMGPVWDFDIAAVFPLPAYGHKHAGETRVLVFEEFLHQVEVDEALLTY